MSNRMSLQEALEIARKFSDGKGDDIIAAMQQRHQQPQSLAAKPTPVAAAAPAAEKPTPTPAAVPAAEKPTPTPAAVPAAEKPTPTPAAVPAAEKPTPTPTPAAVPAAEKPVPTAEKPTHTKKHSGGLADFAARLLSAQTAMEKAQAKYDAARADLEEKKNDLLKATEDIRTNVMKSAGEQSTLYRKYIKSSDPVSLSSRIFKHMSEYPNEIFSARDIGNAVGEATYPKIFTSLNDLHCSGKIIRVTRGRYQYNANGNPDSV